MKAALIILLVSSIPSTLWADNTPKQLTLEQAELLARTAADSIGLTRLKGFSLDMNQIKEFPDYYFFDVLSNQPGAGRFRTLCCEQDYGRRLDLIWMFPRLVSPLGPTSAQNANRARPQRQRLSLA
jgi:hypothetical protein